MRNWLMVVVVALLLAGCGDGGTETSIEVRENATFCSVFDGGYSTALSEAVPITDDSFNDRIGHIVAWAGVLVDLAPDEIASEAGDNLKYHEAQAAVESATDFIPGSNAMHAWAHDSC
ncbi:hypothetical protein HQ535_07290 [bacterium]|nr:hypothetical protein [bacterium]